MEEFVNTTPHESSGANVSSTSDIVDHSVTEQDLADGRTKRKEDFASISEKEP